MKRHRLDPFSLLFGALFLGVGCSFMLGSRIGDAKHEIWPLFAIIVGGTFVVWAIATVVRERRPAVSAVEVAAPADAIDILTEGVDITGDAAPEASATDAPDESAPNDRDPEAAG